MAGCFTRLTSKFKPKPKPETSTTNNGSGVTPAGNGPSGNPATESKPGENPPISSAEEPSPDSETPEVESAEDQTPAPKDRWREAFNGLSEKNQKALEKLGFSGSKPGPMGPSILGLVDTVEAKQQECEKKFWKTKFGGKEIVFREYTTEIVGWLEKAGDIAIEFAPPQASLPWDLVKNLMKIPVNESDQMGALLVVTQVVVSITSRCQVYEDIYLNNADTLSTIQRQLEERLISLYKAALDLLAQAGSLLSAGTPKRILKAIISPGESTDSLAGLGDQEDKLLKDVNACEVNRSATADAKANEKLEKLQAPMARVDAGVSQLLGHVDQQERIRLLEWISPIQFGAHHDEFNEKRTPETGEWLVEHDDFTTWREKDSSVLFWLQGDPGSGKTYLTSKVIDTVKDRINYPLKNEGLAFFYCDRGDKPRDQPLVILQSLVRQLSTTARNPESMQIKLKETCKMAREKGTNFRFEQCQEQILSSLNIYKKTTIVIDALDECDPESRYDLVQALQMFLEKSKNPVKIFISSRPDPVLKNQLDSSPNVYIQASDNLEDIRKFIDVELDKRAKSRTFLEDLKPQIIAKLLERCQGMFQWVNLQVHEIGQSTREDAVYECLESLPEGLEEAYNKVWRGIEKQRKSDQTLTIRALRWVMSASKPLTSDELLWAVRVDTAKDVFSLNGKIDEDGLLSLCGNLLVVDSKLKVWRFSHLSVQEYIEKKPDWTLPQTHHELASACLLLLNDTYEKIDPDTVSSPPEGSKASADLFDLANPFQFYARHHWALHVKAVRDTSNGMLKALLKTLLGSPMESSPRYRRWIRQIQKDGSEPSTSMFRSDSSEGTSDLEPVEFAVLVMCAFAFDDILWDWWQNKDVQLSLEAASGDNLLSLAARAGSMPICKLLLERGLDVNARLAKETTRSALAAAARQGQYEIVKLLVFDAHADVNMPLSESAGSPSALEAAASAGKTEIVKLLVQEGGADVNREYKNKVFGTALVSAAFRAPLETVQYLVKKAGADVTKIVTTGMFATPLEAAAFEGRLDIVKYLIEQTAIDVNLQYSHGKYGSALSATANSHYAKLNFDVIKYLVQEAGADVNVPFARGRYGSVLVAAIDKGDEEIIRFLLHEVRADMNLPLVNGRGSTAWSALWLKALSKRHGAMQIAKYIIGDAGIDLNDPLALKSFGHALVNFSSNKSIEGVKFLTEEVGVDVNMPVDHGQFGSALAAAAAGNSIDVVKYFIHECNADVNMPLVHGKCGSALAAAASEDSIDAVKYLIQECGADVNMPLAHGLVGSALAAAAGGNAINVAKYLIEEVGVDVNMQLQHGVHGSVLATAAFFEDSLDVTSYLVQEAGADVNMPLKYGYYGSGLASAVAAGGLDSVKILVEAKADVNQRLQYGSYGSALGVAAALCDDDCAEYLIQAGAEVNLRFEGNAPFSSALQATGDHLSEADKWLLGMFGVDESEFLKFRVEMAQLLRKHGAEA
ncbi:uncharacterized protein N7484_001434 [Penicillium longicatenatum]|uniref:uncharacterized protein n=1 Tax=Penicillium longicatenatum TaxID=1561947 RepID=UPI0025478AAC|nr:uncharacterized protein N7484_001434 [Penicillium longicatenatum]KAJ5657785.1 hypothetical protein N7484_001434 [Penicillium longicatenatum]